MQTSHDLQLDQLNQLDLSPDASNYRENIIKHLQKGQEMYNVSETSQDRKESIRILVQALNLMKKWKSHVLTRKGTRSSILLVIQDLYETHFLRISVMLEGLKKEIEIEKLEEEAKKRHEDSYIQPSYQIVTQMVNWSEVEGHEEVVQNLRELIQLPILYPNIFPHKKFTQKGILLFGPSAKESRNIIYALAAEIKLNLVQYKPTQNNKDIKQVFQIAEQKTPSVVYIENIENYFNEDNEEAKQILLNFLQCVHSLKQDMFIVSHSTQPWNLVPLIRRRFQTRLSVYTQTPEKRRQLITKLFSDYKFGIDSGQLELLVEQTEGYPLSDVKDCVQETLQCKGEVKRLDDQILQNFLSLLISTNKQVSPELQAQYESWMNEFA